MGFHIDVPLKFEESKFMDFMGSHRSVVCLQVQLFLKESSLPQPREGTHSHWVCLKMLRNLQHRMVVDLSHLDSFGEPPNHPVLHKPLPLLVHHGTAKWRIDQNY